MTTGFPDHFSGVAAGYAEHRPHYPPALADALAEVCAARTLAWDAGCGSGQLSGALATRFAQVIATDPSAAQLAQAAPLANVDYRRATAEASGLPDASVDLAVAAQAAHWFDFPRYVAELARVTRPGAIVALVTYNVLHVEGPADAIVDRYYHDVVGRYWPPERRHVENGYRELVLPWPALASPAIAMTARWTRDQLVGYILTWSATTAMIEAIGRAPVDALHAALAAVWPDGELRTIRWPLIVKLARRP